MRVIITILLLSSVAVVFGNTNTVSLSLPTCTAAVLSNADNDQNGALDVTEYETLLVNMAPSTCDVMNAYQKGTLLKNAWNILTCVCPDDEEGDDLSMSQIAESSTAAEQTGTCCNDEYQLSSIPERVCGFLGRSIFVECEKTFNETEPPTTIHDVTEVSDADAVRDEVSQGDAEGVDHFDTTTETTITETTESGVSSSQQQQQENDTRTTSGNSQETTTTTEDNVVVENTNSVFMIIALLGGSMLLLFLLFCSYSYVRLRYFAKDNSNWALSSAAAAATERPSMKKEMSGDTKCLDIEGGDNFRDEGALPVDGAAR